jgi:hypothetical protein
MVVLWQRQTASVTKPRRAVTASSFAQSFICGPDGEIIAKGRDREEIVL